MVAAIFTSATAGLITIRDLLKTGFVPSIVLSDDSAAFSGSQTSANPTGGTTVTLAKTATISNVSNTSFTATITVNGSTELTNKSIYTIAPATSNSSAAAQGRVVRTNPIGVQAGDSYTIGLTANVADNS